MGFLGDGGFSGFNDAMHQLPLGWMCSDLPWEILPASWLGQGWTSSRLGQKHHANLRGGRHLISAWTSSLRGTSGSSSSSLAPSP